MQESIERYQTGVLVLAVIVAVTVLAVLGEVDGTTVVTGLIGLGNLLLGAGAVSLGAKGARRQAVELEEARRPS